MFITSAVGEGPEPTGKSPLPTVYESGLVRRGGHSSLPQSGDPYDVSLCSVCDHCIPFKALCGYGACIRAHGPQGGRELCQWICKLPEIAIREILLYAARPSPKQSIQPKTKAYKGTHPSTNDFFNKTSVAMPVGSVAHVLAACRNIRQLKLKFGALTNDDLIEFSNYPSSAISGMVFGSDIARSWTQGSAHVQSVPPNFLIRHLPSLLNLRKIQIQDAPWLSREDVHFLLWNCPRVSKIDFRHSGKLRIDHALVVSRKMARWAIPWAMKGSRKECAAILGWHLRVLRRSAEQERRNEPIAGIDLVLTGMNGAYLGTTRTSLTSLVKQLANFGFPCSMLEADGFETRLKVRVDYSYSVRDMMRP